MIENEARLRPLIETDILKLDELWRAHWQSSSLPNRVNCIVDAVVDDRESGRIIGYGQVKLFAEAMLFLDPTTPKRARVKALKLLMAEAFRGAGRYGIEDMYAFIKDPDFALLIEKRYGFQRVIEPGELLLKTGV